MHWKQQPSAAALFLATAGTKLASLDLNGNVTAVDLLTVERRKTFSNS